ncbi:ABC transporter permease [Pseudoflavonifractor sp. HCP28S3_F10]|uniref:ABC transporter permease n=1 Tax=Pseudoflavonifractor sp. HCP28S3_F10 TaxID=3438947 RepID=UPI003F8B07C6
MSKTKKFPWRIEEEQSCSLLKRMLILLGMLALCLTLHSLIMLTMTDDPLQAYITIFKSAFSSNYQVSQTLLNSLPIVWIGLGLSVCLRAGVLNLGGNGSLLAGGLGAAIVGLYMPGLPPVLAILVTVVLSMLFGALWSGLAGILRSRLGISEIYVTVMLNYVMLYFATFMLEVVWQDPLKLNWTEIISENSKWPILINGTSIHLGFLLLGLTLIGILYLNRTPLGYEIRCFGLNQQATLFKLKAWDNEKIILFVMLFSGAIAGLAGASQVAGYQYRFSLAINNDFGFTGIVAAKLGGLNPFGILAAGLLLGVLSSGSTAMQVMTGVPNSIIDVLQGMLLVAAICADRLAMYKIVRVEGGGQK